MLQIAVFGKVSTGKSALLNAVFVTDLFTIDPRAGSTTGVQKVKVEFAGHTAEVVDTPGIGDLADSKRQEVAHQAAREADLVLVVCDKDLTHSEYYLIDAVAKFGKPLLIILNKSDTLSLYERDLLAQQIHHRLADFVDSHNVLFCAAHPLKFYAREKPDGTLAEWTERVTPDVAKVRERIAEILRSETVNLHEINHLAHQTNTAIEQVQSANKRTNIIIEDYALGVAIGVAINPIPLIDLFGGTAAIVVLISKLAECYNVTLSQEQIKSLAGQIATEGWKELWRAVLPIIGGAILKSIPLVGWAIGALGQAIGAYYITYIIGQACSEYIAHNLQWVDSLQETLRQVIARTDRQAITSRAATLIKRRLEALGK